MAIPAFASLALQIDDGRRSFPKYLRTVFKNYGCQINEKIMLTWLVAYIHGIRPNRQLPGWQTFELSHRCINKSLNEGSLVAFLDGGKLQANSDQYLCISPTCLVWESKSVNQSRGYGICFKMCGHKCGKYACACSQLHMPPCL